MKEKSFRVQIRRDKQFYDSFQSHNKNIFTERKLQNLPIFYLSFHLCSIVITCPRRLTRRGFGPRSETLCQQQPHKHVCRYNQTDTGIEIVDTFCCNVRSKNYRWSLDEIRIWCVDWCRYWCGWT